MHRASVPTDNLTYSQFLADVDAHQVKNVKIQTNGKASGALTNGHNYNTVIPVQLAGSSLLDRLEAAKVSISATTPGSTFSTQVVSWVILLLPFLIFGWLWWRMSRGVQGPARRRPRGGASRGPRSSSARAAEHHQPPTVAGYEGAMRRDRRGGRLPAGAPAAPHPGSRATVPRGVLMIGPPGTGKTLLARAVAGEAKVPFFSVAGSSFVELFVGVGAARVRDLFAEARKRAPAIVFVDEIDAIGSRRSGAGAFASNDEREQTLNQLLSEMDGFEPVMGIVVLAATNRPEVLDPALLRPGRFDRQVTIPLPNLAERAAILAVHCRDKRVAPDVNLQTLARATPGFSGADLANLTNEAAIAAVRAGREVITAGDFDAARDRIILGRREDSNVLLPEEKHAVAVHESGHALVAALSDHADPVAKVTILPAGRILGVTDGFLVERHLYGEDYLMDSLAVRLGGRAAEVVVLGQGSTGAANDLAGATDLATRMVREFGLSDSVGPVGYPSGGSMFLNGGSGELSSRPFAEATQAAIDKEVARLLRQAEARATQLLSDNRGHLDELIDLVLRWETIDGAAVYRIIGRPVPTETGQTSVAPRRVAAQATSPTGDVDSGATRPG